MNERKDPPGFNGGKFPANDDRASKGLALAEFIDDIGTNSSDDASVQGSLRMRDVGPVPPAPLASRTRVDVLLMEHPFALAAGSAIAGFVLGVAASAIVRSRIKPNPGIDLALD